MGKAMDTNGHLDEQDLESYSLHTAVDPELAQWEEHLLLCQSCREQVEASDAYVKAMRQTAGQIRLERTKKAYWAGMPRVIFLVAAALLLATALLIRTRRPAPVAVSLFATRGPVIQAQAPVGALLALQLDVAGLSVASVYRVEMVDREGKRVWAGTFPGSIVKPPAAGVYFVRLYGQAGELLREYALEVSPGH